MLQCTLTVDREVPSLDNIPPGMTKAAYHLQIKVDAGRQLSAEGAATKFLDEMQDPGVMVQSVCQVETLVAKH